MVADATESTFLVPIVAREMSGRVLFSGETFQHSISISMARRDNNNIRRTVLTNKHGPAHQSHHVVAKESTGCKQHQQQFACCRTVAIPTATLYKRRVHLSPTVTSEISTRRTTAKSFLSATIS